jgi:phage protein U
MSDLQRFEEERRVGNTNILMRGDGSKLGWFVCEKLVRAHTFLSGEGIGQQVAFEAVLVRVPMPDPSSYVTQVWKASP